MRFVFPVVGSVFIALLFANFYPPLRSPLQVSTSESGLPKRPLQAVTATPAPERDMSPLMLAPSVQTKPAVEAPAASEVSAKVEPAAKSSRDALAKVGPAARATRAEAPPRRVMRSRGYKQTPSFDKFSIKGY